MFFYVPRDYSHNLEGQDVYSNPSIKMCALTSQLGLEFAGFNYGSLDVSGRVEADFYLLNGTSASMRFRQAYVDLVWNHVGYMENKFSIRAGQAWHPMAVDLPHMTNLESGAPFNPFSRTPQLTADISLGAGFTFTASVMYLNHYLPTGPSGKVKDYYKYGLPEFYAGFGYKGPHFAAKIGVDIINTRPIGFVGHNNSSPGTLVRGYNMDVREHKASGILTAVSPFVFLQYTNGLFQLKAKSIFAQSGEQFNLLSGYGLASIDDVNYKYTYTPMQDWASFVSFQYGKKFQVMCMLGYMKQFGTTTNLADVKQLWLNTSADAKIQQDFRATPTVVWNLGKFALSLEYNLTAAQFGEGERNARGMYGNAHWLMNHRFICMTKFNF